MIFTKTVWGRVLEVEEDVNVGGMGIFSHPTEEIANLYRINTFCGEVFAYHCGDVLASVGDHVTVKLPRLLETRKYSYPRRVEQFDDNGYPVCYIEDTPCERILELRLTGDNVPSDETFEI